MGEDGGDHLEADRGGDQAKDQVAAATPLRLHLLVTRSAR